MTSRTASICMSMMFVLSVYSNGHTQEESKSWWSKMFSRSATDSASAKANSDSDPDKTPWYKQFGQKNESTSSPKKRGSSAISRMGQTSKRWWDNTVDFVNPFNDKPAPPKNQGYAPQNEKKKSDDGGLFGWAKPEKKPSKPTVNEFLGGTNPLLEPDSE